MIIIKNSEQIALMKKAGQITAEALLVAEEVVSILHEGHEVTHL